MAAQFQKLLPPSFLALAQAAAGIKRNNSLYSPLVVLWLLIAQRLHGGASLEIAVNELFHGLPASFWPRPCKRLRDWRQRGIAPSSNTGAYNQARQSLPLIMVQACSDHIFNQLLERFGQPPTEDSPQAFLLDGSTIRMAHTPELRKRYPPVRINTANRIGPCCESWSPMICTAAWRCARNGVPCTANIP